MTRWRETTTKTIEVEHPNLLSLPDDYPEAEQIVDVDCELEWEESDEETNGGGYWTLVSYSSEPNVDWLTEEMVQNELDKHEIER